MVVSHWQRVGDLIGSGYEPHTSRTRSEHLTTCAIWFVLLLVIFQISFNVFDIMDKLVFCPIMLEFVCSIIFVVMLFYKIQPQFMLVFVCPATIYSCSGNWNLLHVCTKIFCSIHADKFVCMCQHTSAGMCLHKITLIKLILLI